MDRTACHYHPHSDCCAAHWSRCVYCSRSRDEYQTDQHSRSYHLCPVDCDCSPRGIVCADSNWIRFWSPTHHRSMGIAVYSHRRGRSMCNHCQTAMDSIYRWAVVAWGRQCDRRAADQQRLVVALSSTISQSRSVPVWWTILASRSVLVWSTILASRSVPVWSTISVRISVPLLGMGVEDRVGIHAAVPIRCWSARWWGRRAWALDTVGTVLWTQTHSSTTSAFVDCCTRRLVCQSWQS